MLSPAKSSELDAIPTWLLKQCMPQLIPFITAFVNKSLSSVRVYEADKMAIVRPLLKKPGADPMSQELSSGEQFDLPV